MQIEQQPELNFLSELYANDSSKAVLLAEYPSSNSPATPFQNRQSFIIHDPFPPPQPELMQVLGPHHLMCGWGNRLPVASRLAPPKILTDHWDRLFNRFGCGDARPVWQPAWPIDQDDTKFITLFPHESIAAGKQAIDPAHSYAIHSKEIIEEIDCPQANVLTQIELPCMVKLSHGYAGLGNFLLRTPQDVGAMQEQLQTHWPDATLVINSVIEDIVGDFGVQFYLRADGSIVWLGLTEQKFDATNRWCGGVYCGAQQTELRESLAPFVVATAQRLAQSGYQGLVGIDVLRTKKNEFYLVDVNPRLTGISPFLMASRIFKREQNLEYGIYRASCRFAGTLEQLIEAAEQCDRGTVMVLSGFEDVAQTGAVTTIGHLSVSSTTLQACEATFESLIENRS